MSESMTDLEKDIEESRARLDRTIDRLQDRLSPGNLVEEMLGSARGTPVMNDVYNTALDTVRRNPLPVLLIAAGVGMLFSKATRGAVAQRQPSPSAETRPVSAPVTPSKSAHDLEQPAGRSAEVPQADMTVHGAGRTRQTPR